VPHDMKGHIGFLGGKGKGRKMEGETRGLQKVEGIRKEGPGPHHISHQFRKSHEKENGPLRKNIPREEYGEGESDSIENLERGRQKKREIGTLEMIGGDNAPIRDLTVKIYGRHHNLQKKKEDKSIAVPS